jgi:ribonuclease toxin BrnT of type II toxin-antitoxin system
MSFAPLSKKIAALGSIPTCRPESRSDHVKFGYSSSPQCSRTQSCIRYAWQLTGVLLYIHIRLHKAIVEFAWDEGKNRINKRKHGVSFDTAVLVFDDPYHLTRQDREVDGEPR